jgi:hypothetical protein
MGRVWEEERDLLREITEHIRENPYRTANSGRSRVELAALLRFGGRLRSTY